MGFNTKDIIHDKSGKPVPQHYSPETDTYEVVKGSGGASYVQLKGAGINEDGSLNVKFNRVASTDAAVTDPTLSANDISLLKGISKILQGGGTGALPTTITGSIALKGAVQNVTTAGTRVRLPDYACTEVTVIAKDSNVGAIYVGGSDVSSTVYGVKLKADGSYTFRVSNTNLIYIDASVNGEGVSYVAI